MTLLRSLSLALVSLAAACTVATTPPRANPGNTVRANGKDYLVIACRGARSAGIRCPAQTPVAAYFRGGVVCQSGDEQGAREVDASTIPREVCEPLTNGCEAAAAAPSGGAYPAITNEERERITSAGFTVVAVSSTQFRLEFTPPPPPPPPQPEPAPIDPNAPPTQQPEPQPVVAAAPQPVLVEPHDALVARTDAIRAALASERVVSSDGIGLCATAAGESLPQGALCVRLGLTDASPRPDVLAQRFGEVARAGTAVLRLSLTYTPPATARCAPGDEDCMPLTASNVCPEQIGIRRGATRSALAAAINSGTDWSRYESGRCRNDGDCMIGGCGQHCVAATQGSFASTCEGVSGLEYAACGCLRGRCRWFIGSGGN